MFSARIVWELIDNLGGTQEASHLQGRDSRWRIGSGGIARDEVIVIGVVHVSQGSWQPILQLRRYVL